MKRYTDYDPFAWLYSTRWGREYHEQAYRILHKLVLYQAPRGARILDLCCGDGRLASVLEQNGFRVTGLDGSEEMLRIARERCPRCEFVLGDARWFETPDKFDIVISTFDALNHVMTPDDLASVCRRVYAALGGGGWFAFDLNREEAYTELWSATSAMVDPEAVSVSRGWYDHEARIAYCDITLFRLLDGAWRRSDFQLAQFCHREQDVLDSLFAAGFVEAKAYDASNDLGMTGNIGQGRTYYLARKAV
jgi:SAM-dependent methyltransferase